jgi:serine/threonine-protein kinase
MGVVYLAEQIDLRRRVALKFLKPELATSASQRARLMVEATALARLQHPNIVQVFSTGTHEGRSFIVEEYVGGGNLHRQLSRQPVPARSAAEIVATLARAVEHAHSHRIIHRDLKPSNVLLTEGGVAKISDFGLAKQFDLDGQSAQTHSGAILGSPSYMAPEQTLAKPGTTGPAADIYALGAILYEMLTGRPPFLAASTHETLEQVRALDPVAPRQLQPGLPRDVETICLKCLSKDPTRRYPTAAALADDLDRFLHDHPILARPVSVTEHVVKWIRRRPATAASLAVAAMAAAALLTGGLVYQGLLRAALVRADESAELAIERKKKADARYRVARKTLSQMLDQFRSRDLRQTPRLRELKRRQLDNALGFYREVVRDREDPDPAVRLDVAEAYLQSSNTQVSLGRDAEAREQINQSIAMLERLANEDPARPEHRSLLAQAYRTRAYIGSPAHKSGNFESAENARPNDLDRALVLFENLVHDDPGNPRLNLELASTCHNIATGSMGQGGNRTLAEPLFRRAIDLRRRLLESSPSAADAPTRVQLAESLESLAVLVQGTDHNDEAQSLYAESRRLIEDALRIEPQWDDASIVLAHTLMNWGINLSSEPGSYAKAASLFEEALSILGSIVDREPDWSLARDHLSNCHGGLANLREREGRHADSARHWEQVVSLAASDQRQHHQFFLALALARAGEHRKAWNLLQLLRPSLAKLSVEYCVQLAQVGGACLEAIDSEKTLSPQERSVLHARYEQAALALVRQALELVSAEERAGWREQLRDAKELAGLRRLPEFHALVGKSNDSASLNPAGASTPPGNK